MRSKVTNKEIKTEQAKKLGFLNRLDRIEIPILLQSSHVNLDKGALA